MAAKEPYPPAYPRAWTSTGITKVADAGAGRSRHHAAVVRRDRPGHAQIHPRRGHRRRWRTARPSTPMPAASCRCARRIAGFPQAHHRRRYRRRRASPCRARPCWRWSAPCNALVETGDNIVIVSPIWPNIFQAAQDRRRRAPSGAAGRRLERRPLAARSRQAVRRLRRAHQGDLHRLARQSHRLDDDARTSRSRSWISRASAASPSSATKSMARWSMTAARMRRPSCHRRAGRRCVRRSTASPSPGR